MNQLMRFTISEKEIAERLEETEEAISILSDKYMLLTVKNPKDKETIAFLRMTPELQISTLEDMAKKADHATKKPIGNFTAPERLNFFKALKSAEVKNG